MAKVNLFNIMVKVAGGFNPYMPSLPYGLAPGMGTYVANQYQGLSNVYGNLLMIQSRKLGMGAAKRKLISLEEAVYQNQHIRNIL